jgi:ribonuclease E
MRESIRKDRARIQVGRISNFGLLEMTRQRLREGSINWKTILSLESFSQKMIKKIELLAFTNKVKIIRTYVPEKVKLIIDNKLSKEIEYFEKKYSFKIDFLADAKLIIPEYKIELLNKSKKIINTVENIDKINEIKDSPKSIEKSSKTKNENKTNLKKIKKIKIIKKKTTGPRTLWVRRKKKA